jgi:hypothetical protein
MVLTKVQARHPDGAAKNAGVISLKRLVMHTHTVTGKTVADVMKVGYCIRCPDFTFSNIWAADINPTEFPNFVNECVVNAFSDGSSQSAGLKPEYRCTGEDSKFAQASIAGF